MFNKRIKQLKDQVDDLQRRVIILEQRTTYPRYSGSSLHPHFLNIKHIVDKILIYLGLTLEWHQGTEGYCTLEKTKDVDRGPKVENI